LRALSTLGFLVLEELGFQIPWKADRPESIQAFSSTSSDEIQSGSVVGSMKFISNRTPFGLDGGLREQPVWPAVHLALELQTRKRHRLQVLLSELEVD
jgi:hypothetical protein